MNELITYGMATGDYAQIWLEFYHKNRIELTSYWGYAAEIKKLLKYSPLACKSINLVNSVDIQNFIYYLTTVPYQLANQEKERYYSKSSIKKTLNVLRALFKFACFNGDIEKNPTKNVYLPRERDVLTPRREITPYPLEDSQKIIAAVLVRGEFAQAGLAIVFLLETGLRIGELLALTVDDVDLNQKKITVSKQYVRENNKLVLKNYLKSSAGKRTLPLTKNAAKVFLEINRKKGLIFQTQRGTPYNQRYIAKTLRIMEERLGLEKRGGTLHQLRHTFASNALMLETDNGDFLPVKLISKWLGHSDIALTMNVYADVLASREKEISYTLDNLYRS